MPEKLFTLDEALVLLPVARQLLIEIQQCKLDLDKRSAELDRLLGLVGGNGHLTSDIAAARQALEAAGNRLQGLIAELEEMGVELKGIEEGLIDFRSLREGRVVYLCYRLGEDTIAYWHELDTGFPGRQPL